MSLSLNGPSLLDSISAIRSGRFDWKLRVRVVRIWDLPDRGVDDVVNSVEMILVDQLGDRIQATILKRLVPLFRGTLFEGEIYRMSFFSVLPNVGLLLCTSHPYKLLFDLRTSVRPAVAFSIPLSLMATMRQFLFCSTMVHGKKDLLICFRTQREIIQRSAHINFSPYLGRICFFWWKRSLLPIQLWIVVIKLWIFVAIQSSLIYSIGRIPSLTLSFFQSVVVNVIRGDNELDEHLYFFFVSL